jgi:hypothetical protein
LLDAFPEGGLSEIVGPRSSGGGSLLLALLARAASRGGLVALVDGADSFDPETAERAGLDLRALLWVRCGGRLPPAWSAADLLARCPGFDAVALDVGTASVAAPPSFGVRLQRAAAGWPWSSSAPTARDGQRRRARGLGTPRARAGSAPGASVLAGLSPEPRAPFPLRRLAAPGRAWLIEWRT